MLEVWLQHTRPPSVTLLQFCANRVAEKINEAVSSPKTAEILVCNGVFMSRSYVKERPAPDQ